MSSQSTEKSGMWREIGETVRMGMTNWGTTARLCVCVAVLAAAAVLIIWVQARA
jgi:hypothetical protein